MSAPDGDLERLRNLPARYSFNADLGRSRDYPELCTVDGAIDLGPRPAGVHRHTTRWTDHPTRPPADRQRVVGDEEP